MSLGQSYDDGMTGVMTCAAAPVLGALVGGFRLKQGKDRSRNAEAASEEKQRLAFMVSGVMICVCMVYGVIGALIINTNLSKQPSFMPGNAGYTAGLVIGLSAAFVATGIGFVGEAAVQSLAVQPRLFVGFVLVQIYVEAFALYGLILGLVIMKNATQQLVDIAPNAAMPFASISVLANFGGIFGSVAAGVAIMELGVMRPDLIMRSMIPIVMSGVTGIYGLIESLIDTKPWPPSGNDALAGLFYLVSSVGIAYVGNKGVKNLEEQPQTFVQMVVQLIMCQSIGLMGLMYGLVTHTSSMVQQSQQSGDGPYELSASVLPTTLLAKDLVINVLMATAFVVPLLFVACSLKSGRRELEAPLL
mmetsp:Transcript_127683/g.248850  ORF Transcript_127683/g.248850 Transcript_127683/m.248850 type:complete len:360 (-) Transcript_127683:130-1209(-)